MSCPYIAVDLFVSSVLQVILVSVMFHETAIKCKINTL